MEKAEALRVKEAERGKKKLKTKEEEARERQSAYDCMSQSMLSLAAHSQTCTAGSDCEQGQDCMHWKALWTHSKNCTAEKCSHKGYGVGQGILSMQTVTSCSCQI